MTMRCPYLGLEADRSQALPEATSRHRCYKVPAGEAGKPGRPERVGTGYQTQVCLGQAHFRCPRLKPLIELKSTESTEGRAGSRVDSVVSRGRAAKTATSGGGAKAAARNGTAVSRGGATKAVWSSRNAAEWTDRTTSGGAKVAAAGGGRRPLTLTELVVMGLGVSLAAACLFAGLVVVYRLKVGPGMSAAPEVAAGSKGLPTLVPTFTPIVTVVASAPVTSTMPLTGTEQAVTPAVPTPAVPSSRPPATSPPTRLVIPKIGLDIPVLSVGTKTTQASGKTRTVWADVPNAGGFHETSAYPGNTGNTVINGHRDILGAVFRHLDAVAVGDEITLYVGEVAYPYRVVEVLVVPEVFASASQRAENLRLIGYMPEERLTLVTCTPVALATHRLLVIAWPP